SDSNLYSNNIELFENLKYTLSKWLLKGCPGKGEIDYFFTINRELVNPPLVELLKISLSEIEIMWSNNPFVVITDYRDLHDLGKTWILRMDNKYSIRDK